MLFSKHVEDYLATSKVSSSLPSGVWEYFYTMKLLTGIVQLLFLQNWSLMMGRAMPVNSASCENSKNCSDIKIIVTQIQNKIRQMHAMAQNLSIEYMAKNGITNQSHCNPDGLALNLSIQDLGKEETMVELHRISVFLRDALHNITLFQNGFFSKNTEWIATLNNVVMELKVLISNLNCYLCQKNGWSQVATGSYHVNLEKKTSFQKKVIGCKLIMKYKNFISQAAEIDLKALLNSDQK